MTLETPIVGHEEVQELITTARRKLFVLTMKSDMGLEDSDLRKKLSVVSLNGSEEGTLPSVLGGGLSAARPPTSKKKTVTFFEPESSLPSSAAPLPPIASSFISSSSSSDPIPLIRARLVPKSSQEHILVLSFPQVVCDYWSSCLFVQQLADCYAKLEQSQSYRPSVMALKAEGKRQAMVAAFDQERGRTTIPPVKPPRNALQSSVATSRLVHKKSTGPTNVDTANYVPPFPANLQFHQVAHRESQLLKVMSREKLWSFWQSMATATIHRQRGPPRVKVIPPVRLPSGLGQKVAKRQPPAAPAPSGLRPLTARSRPQTARRGTFASGASYELLNGPQTQFHFIKVRDSRNLMLNLSMAFFFSLL